MPSVFADVRAFALVAIALAMAAGPADARLERGQRAISVAERASIGASLAFVREDGARREAFVLSADGRSERALDPGPWQSYPAAASRGGELAIVRAVEGGAHEESLVVRSADGRIDVLARGAMVRSPSFSPDGASLAFESDRASFRDLYRVARSGGDAIRLTDDREGNYEPSWSDGGRAIVFTSSRDGEAEVYRMAADGTAPERLTRSPGDDVAPRPSPDGRSIAFLSARDGVDHVFVMNADGSNVRRVRAATNDEEREHTWSPDGARLAFVAKARNGKSRVLVWDGGRDVIEPITDGATVADMPAFSPDGRYIAFVNDDGKGPDVWIARADGSGAVRAGAARGRRWLPVWIPARATFSE